MKTTAILLAAALLWASHASGQISNIVNSRQGIAYSWFAVAHSRVAAGITFTQAS